MADPLSVAGSVAGLVTMADVVFSRTFRYAKAVKGAAKDIEKLASEIRSLSGVLHGLSLVVSELETDTIKPNLRLHHVNSCCATLTKIQRKLERNDPLTAKDQPVEAALRSLKWPFSSSETKELLAEVGRHNATIGMALSADNMVALLQVLSRQNELGNEIQDMKTKIEARWAAETRIALDNERQEILNFFGKFDPRPNHETSLKLRHPLTGLWLTEGETFKTWLHTRNSKLWLSGIPGAGKTVLAASVVEETIKESSPNRAVAYFYCDYKDERSQDPVTILGSLATQLSKQSEKCFALLQEHFLACHPKDKGSPILELSALGKKVKEMASSFDDVSIIVDGLDECGKSTTRVIDSLVSLASDISSNTRTLFLSREEYEIREILQEHYNHIEIAANSEDLRLYVAAEIEIRMRKTGREQLRIKNLELKKHIMETLVDRADGMFRWVACQMDYLCELPNDAARRKALETLPPTLNKTYERILERVNQSAHPVQRLVQKTLQWIVYCRDDLPTAALCEAVAIEEGDKFLDKESICEEDEILLHCSSLIRRSAGANHLELAHFTVKEFLNGIDPERNCALAAYALEQGDVNRRLARTCLTYLNLHDFRWDLPEDLDTWEEQLEQYPFRIHAVMCWDIYARENWDDPSLFALAKNLFKPSKSQNLLSWARDYIYLHFTTRDPEDKHDDFGAVTTSICTGATTPLHIAAVLGHVELCEWLIAAGSDVNQMSRLGTPLHCAILGRSAFHAALYSGGETPPYMSEARSNIVPMLLDAGADCRTPYRDLDCKTFSCFELALHVAIGHGAHSCMTALSAAGAPVDKQFLAALAKKMSCRGGRGDWEWVTGFVDTLRSTLIPEVKDELLKLALRLKSSTALFLVKNKGDETHLASLKNLEDLLRQAAKFDQKEVMENLFLDNRLDPNSRSPYSKETALHVAAEHESPNAMGLLLSIGADVCAVDCNGQTPLHRSAGNVNGHCMSLLLDHGAVADAVDDDGYTIWHLAAESGNVAALNVLLERIEAKDSALALPSKKGLIPIFHAADAESSAALMLLLSHTDHIPESPNRTSLTHYSVQMNSIEVLQMLLEKGAQLDGRNDDGLTALHFIQDNAQSDLVRLLTSAGVEPTSVTSNGETPLHVLLSNERNVDVEVVELLATRDSANMATKDGFTALHYAVTFQTCGRGSLPYAKRKEYVETLVAKGADLAAKDPSGRSCLHILLDQLSRLERSRANDGIDDLADMTSYVMESVTDMDVLHETFHGRKPLSWAIIRRDDVLVQNLLAKGINVDLRDDSVEAWSALHYACVYRCSREVFRQMLRISHRLREPDGNGHYLPHLMCGLESRSDSSLLTDLREAGVDVNSSSAFNGETPLIVAARAGKLNHLKVLLRNTANPRARDLNGWEAAQYAAFYGHASIIHALQGLDIDWTRFVTCGHLSQHFRDCNVLHLAAIRGGNLALHYIAGSSLIADIDCRNGDGESPLHLAAIGGNPETVEILISYGANINAETKAGACPVHYAAIWGNTFVGRALLQHGCSLAADARGMTPELYALKHGRIEISSILREHRLQQGTREDQADSHASDSNPRSSRTLAITVQLGDLELCASIIESGASLDAEIDGCGGCTLVLTALNAGHYEIARHLVRKGAPTAGQICNRSITRGYSAVHLASREESQTDILRELLSKESCSGNRSFQSPVLPTHIAVACGNNAGLKILLQHIQGLDRTSEASATSEIIVDAPTATDKGPDCHKETLTWDAGISSREVRRHRPAAPSLLDAQVDERNLQWGWLLAECVSFQAAPLTTESGCTGTALHVAAVVNNIPATELLLKLGADGNCPNKDHQTPLHVACAYNHTALIDLLLRSGSNPNARDCMGLTPAMLAATEGHVASLERLCAHHVDFSICDTNGRSAVGHAASGGPETFSHLLALGCDPYSRNVHDETPLYWACYNCYRYPAFAAWICNSDLDLSYISDRYGGVLQSQAFTDANVSTLRMFLRRIPKGTKVRDINFSTTFEISILYGAAIKGAMMVMCLLIHEGAGLEVEGGTEGTPLMAACAVGRLSAVKHLTRAGAKLSYTKDGKFRTAVHAARYFPSVVHWLLVGQYTEQFKIALAPAETTKYITLREWSGPMTVEVSTLGMYSPWHGEALFDRAVRLHRLRRDLAGTVIRIQ